MELRRPRPLAPGDTVAVIAPSSPVQEDLFLAGIREIESLGWRAVYDPSVFESDRYLAGPDPRRTAEIHRWFADPAVRAVFCARGGYGAPRLLPLLDEKILGADPRILVGFSDSTALLHLLLDRCRIPVVHGPMVAWDLRQGTEKYDRALLLHLLTSREPAGRLTAPSFRTLLPGRAAGALAGGCLTLLAGTAGTPWAPRTGGAILLIEDWRMKPYQIDRALVQLRLAGLLDGVRGILFGEMNECRQVENQGYALEEVIADALRDLGIPVAFGFPTGHTRGMNRPVPLGARATLDASRPEAALILEEGIVR